LISIGTDARVSRGSALIFLAGMVALVETEESAKTGDAEADAEEPTGAAGG
jgi:hypothetical protein